MKSEIVRLQHEQAAMKERIKDNKEKIKMNKQLPYLVGNVVEVKYKTWTGVVKSKTTNKLPSYSMSIQRKTKRKVLMLT